MLLYKYLYTQQIKSLPFSDARHLRRVVRPSRCVAIARTAHNRPSLSRLHHLASPSSLAPARQATTFTYVGPRMSASRRSFGWAPQLFLMERFHEQIRTQYVMTTTRDLVGRMAAKAAGMVGGLSPVPSEPLRARWGSTGLAYLLSLSRL